MPLRRWPAESADRWLVRALIALPLAALALQANTHGYRDLTNSTLSRQASLIKWGSSDLSFVRHLYPPLPTALAAIVPGSAAWLGILGAVAGGVVLHAIAERLIQLQYPGPVVVFLTVSFGASPAFLVTATSQLQSFLTLALCIVALDGFLRFALRGHTLGGFQAGLAVGLAAGCDPFAFLFAVGLAVAAPLIANFRFRGQPQTGRAAAAVLLLPSAAFFVGWTFLQWRFTGSALGWLADAAPGLPFHGGVIHQLRAAFHVLWLPILLTPLFVIGAALAANRSKVAALGYTILPLGIFVSAWIGLTVTRVEVSVLLGAVALIALPRRPRPALQLVVMGAAVVQLALLWGFGTGSPIVHEWTDAVLGR